MSFYDKLSLPKLFDFFVKMQGKAGFVPCPVGHLVYDTRQHDVELEREEKQGNNIQNNLDLKKVKMIAQK